MEHFKIENLGPIHNVDIEFGDLTFFVGPQASGKSICLEALKLIKDRSKIISTLEQYNYIIDRDPKRLLNGYFGEGLSKLWNESTKVVLDERNLTLDTLTKKEDGGENTIFYIPAQRIVCMGDGYPKFFNDFTIITPYVLRDFSETLRNYVQSTIFGNDKVFPLRKGNKNIAKGSFDKNIFHDGKVVLSEYAGQKKMFLEADNLDIPFMAWSTGQKEFMPLLLAFYCLMDSGSNKDSNYSTVIIEEPEMGLHPSAIESILLQICELIGMGYKVVVSTHSSLFIEFAWAFNTLKNMNVDVHAALCSLFKVTKGSSLGKMLKTFKEKAVRTYYFSRSNESEYVSSKDISSLDVLSQNVDLSEWGGIMGFSTRANDTVSKFVNYD